MEGKGFATLKKEVIDSGLCHSCGTCAGVCPRQAIEISYGPLGEGEPEPILAGECDDCVELCSESCPGKTIPLPGIDAMLFARTRNQASESLGIFRECLGGFARNEIFRRNGAGGGATLALLDYAFRHKIIDGAIVSAFDKSSPWQARPMVISSADELEGISEYSYSLVPVNALIRQAVEEKGLSKVALVGLPCHIQGFRKMQFQGACQGLTAKIVLSVGVFCPTNFFSQYIKHVLVEKCGIEKFATIRCITFHGGETPKHLVVTLINGKEIEIDFFTLLFWGIGNYIHQRCAVCYDWTAEVADISIGDFWEPWPAPGDPGWSTILTRTDIGERVVHEAQRDNVLYARPTPEDFLVASFAWEIKKHASAYRLAWRSSHTPNPVPDYGYSVEEALALRQPKSAPWRVSARLHGLLSGIPPEEKR